jgi:hypothetical protein
MRNRDNYDDLVIQTVELDLSEWDSTARVPKKAQNMRVKVWG